MKKIFISCLFVLYCIAGNTQDVHLISGEITDTSGAPLSNASIIDLATKKGTLTDSAGRFSLAIAGKSARIEVSLVGFTSQKLTANEGTDLLIKLLQAQESNLDNVVVVGYQAQSLKKTTSAVQVISGRDIENLPGPSFDQLLQGKVAGVNIQNFSGEPGVRNTFTVRGNSTIVTNLNTDEFDAARTMSTPLYVIDGVPMSVTDMESISSSGTNLLAGLSLADIESLSVQKDAAATAVWGARGANGVIVIKTKKGKSRTPLVRASYYRGLVEKPKLLPTAIGAEERRQKMDLINAYGSYSQKGTIPQMLSDSLNPSFNNATDWQDIFYSSGKIDNADLSVSQGTDNYNYRVSANYYNEDGIVRQTGVTKYSLRGNFGFNFSPKFTTNFNISASRLNRKRGLGKGKEDVLPISPTQMPSSFYPLSDADRAFYFGQFDKLKDKNQTDQLSISMQTKYRILEGLEYTFMGAYSSANDQRSRFQPSSIASDGRSFAENKSGVFESYQLTNTLGYTKSFGERTHNLGVVATQQFQVDQKSGSVLGGYNVPDDNIKAVFGIPQNDLYGKSYEQKAGLLSYLAQFSYDFKERYLLNLSLAANASSRFGDDTKWGYFPAVSLGYIISDEPFMKNVEWINELKIRGSYGLSGTMPEDFYAPFNIWDLDRGTYNGIVQATPSFEKPITLPNLTWNKSNQANIGLNLSMFKSRINLTADAYRRYNTNPILSFPFPFFTGYTAVVYNAPVKILNEGIELNLNTKNLGPQSALQWETNIVFSYNKNRIAALPNGNRSFFSDSRNYNQSLIYSVGAPIYGWAQMRYNGVYNRNAEIPVNPYTGQRLTYFKGNNPVQPGYPNWIDVNKDWDVWSDEDKGEQFGDLVPTGDPNPRFTGGIYNQFTFKQFFVGIQCTYTFGRDIINNFDANQFAGVWNFGNTIYDFARFRLPDLSGKDYWTPAKATDPNYKANFPSISPYGPNFYQFLPFSTMWNENGNYFKIRSATLGYTVPAETVQRIGFKNGRIFAIIDNIYSFQRSNVPDAELVTPQGEYTGSAYPLPRKYTLGFELTF